VAVRTFTAAQYRLSLHTTQAAWHPDILTTPLPLLFGALVLTRRESGRASVVGNRRARRWRWGAIRILPVTLSLEALTFPFKSTTLLL